MIITKQKSLEAILKILESKQKVFIVGCGDCATACKTGGEEEVKKMADFLSARGKQVTGYVVPETTCVTAKLKSALAKHRKALTESDCCLVLACGSGVQCAKESDRYNIEYYPGCDSLFAALVDDKGVFKEVCSTCGECVLELTQGICPVTRCAKGLLNGPCGGQNKGKCEVDKDRDCAWILIYNRLVEKGQVDLLRVSQPAKDHSKAAKPRQVRL
ncbi:MAG: methylenetetrahydrofolate reductase C-terminal domain-containing protein [Candidatus Omnitrophota bacterium]